MAHDCNDPRCNNPDCVGVSAAQKEISARVEIDQWALIGIGESKETATFVYSVGLHHHKLPELIMIGLHPHIAMHIINDCADLMIANGPFKHGTKIDELANMPTIIVNVLDSLKPVYATQAFNHYGHWDFKLQQLVMPDEKQLFPWDSGFSDHMRKCQKLLGHPPMEKMN